MDIETAWAAGLMEGEGSVSLTTNGHALLSLGMTDKEPVVRFAEVVGGKVYGPYAPRQAGHKARWSTYIFGKRRVEPIYQRIRELLSERRRQQFEEVLSEAKDTELRGEYECADLAGQATAKGYFRHKKRGEEPCEICREAFNAYHRQICREAFNAYHRQKITD